MVEIRNEAPYSEEINMGTDSVSTYFTKLKELWVEYDALVPSLGCDCPKSRDYIEHLQQHRLLQFFSGLNESYEQARRKIFIKTIEPSLNQAYAMSIEDESQRTQPFPPLTGKIDPMAMHVGRGQSYKGKKPYMQCKYCNMNGHLKENCYRLIGYLADFKAKKKFVVNNKIGNNVVDKKSHAVKGEVVGESAKGGYFFAEEQYNQIFGMLNGNKDVVVPQVNLAGYAASFMVDLGTTEWIVDSAASHHITASLNTLTDVSELNFKEEVHLPNRAKSNITHIGIVEFLESMRAKDVLYVSNFRYNLLSVSKLTKSFSCVALFFPDFCIFQDFFTGKVRGIGKEQGGLYILRQRNNQNSVKNLLKNAVVQGKIIDSGLWDRRLGHASIKTKKHMSFLQDKVLNVVTNKDCSICPLAKQNMLMFPTCHTFSEKPLELIHMDVWIIIGHLLMIENIVSLL
ncbi:uncharacterized protein [Nicotiana sylvestris]|uniref:uncharacterized protein n=1 Tax=Nicotiana sylvestris TaxID=4096 RepID=UPI00388C8B18